MIMNLKKKHKKIEKLKNINTYQGFLVSPPKIKLPYIPKELLTQTVTKVDKHLLNICYFFSASTSCMVPKQARA